MGRPKLVRRLEIDEALNSHNCRFNKKHRIKKGDRRLTLYAESDPRRYCLECAEKIVDSAFADLEALKRELASDD